MAIVQVRDVPEEVAQAVAAKAKSNDQSVSAYLRELMAADVKQELQRRAIEKWDNELKKTQATLGVTGRATVSSATVIREIRDEYAQEAE